MNALIELLQISLGSRDSFSEPIIKMEDWLVLLKAVEAHSLIGVTYPAIEKMGRQGLVPVEIVLPWEIAVGKIRKKNMRQRAVAGELYRTFGEEGFRSCILKGQSMAACFPDPSLRQTGDVDIWMEGDRDAIIAFLRSRYSVSKVRYIHCEFKSPEGLDIEAHFTPSWMNAPWSNRRLQRWFTDNSDAQFSHFNAALGFNVPTLAFDAVYILIHIYRHVLEEGIGLRQLLDYYHVLRLMTDADRLQAVRDLRHLKLYRFAQAVMFVMQDVFGMDASYLICEPDVRLGAFLKESIMISGNFGQADPRNANSRKQSLVVHGWHKFMRNLRFWRFSPSEALFMPLFVTWQYLWRRRHGFLHNGR